MIAQESYCLISIFAQDYFYDVAKSGESRFGALVWVFSSFHPQAHDIVARMAGLHCSEKPATLNSYRSLVVCNPSHWRAAFEGQKDCVGEEWLQTVTPSKVIKVILFFRCPSRLVQAFLRLFWPLQQSTFPGSLHAIMIPCFKYPPPRDIMLQQLRMKRKRETREWQKRVVRREAQKKKAERYVTNSKQSEIDKRVPVVDPSLLSNCALQMGAELSETMMSLVVCSMELSQSGWGCFHLWTWPTVQLSVCDFLPSW